MPVRLIAALLAVLVVPWAARAETLEGKIVTIADGDSLTLLANGNEQIRIRLAEIDTPERSQPFATRAQEVLSELVFGKQVRAEVQDTDRYGRRVARLYMDELDVNAELVRRGAAWVHPKYVKDDTLFGLEKEARDARRGLWALPETQHVPPWEWRLRKAEQAPGAERKVEEMVLYKRIEEMHLMLQEMQTDLVELERKLLRECAR
jgi:endonuclease YncB( thermonuclease family)